MGTVRALGCIRCGAEYPVGPIFTGCPACAEAGSPSNLTPLLDYSAIKVTRESFTGSGLWRYGALLPCDPADAVTLAEGGTPLYKLDAIAKELGVGALYVKDESRNPTGSFKDRLCSVAVTAGKQFGAEVVTTSSTGNHGAATAAYAARAGMDCVIFTLASVPLAMKVSMQTYGAKLVATPTSMDRWTIMAECINTLGWYPSSNYVLPMIGSNCFGIDGYKTIAFEIVEQLGWQVPDRVVMPVAYADGLYGTWKGFQEFKSLGLVDRTPKMVAAEVYGPITAAHQAGANSMADVNVPTPNSSIAFSIATPMGPYQGLKAVAESGGQGFALNDDAALLRWQKRLGREGIYAEPSSCLSLASLEQMAKGGALKDEVVVCVLTATGLKDPEASAKVNPAVPVVEPTRDALAKALAEHYGFTL